MQWKYILLEMGDKKIPILFPEDLSHKFVWQAIREAAYRQKEGNPGLAMPESMGFATGVTVRGVKGESESVRYGFDAVPRDMWDATKAHPESDLLIINGGRTLEAIEKSDATSHRDTVKLILTKGDPATRHLSSAGRRGAAIDYAEKHLADEVAAAGSPTKYVTDLWRETGALK